MSQKLRVLRKQLWVRNQLPTRQVYAVVEMLVAGIPLLALKGSAMLLHYTSEQSFRYLGDIDLAVPVERLDEAFRILDRCGWTRPTATRKNERYWIFDIHSRLIVSPSRQYSFVVPFLNRLDFSRLILDIYLSI